MHSMYLNIVQLQSAPYLYNIMKFGSDHLLAQALICESNVSPCTTCGSGEGLLPPLTPTDFRRRP